jgi:hypothetical protein
MTRLCLSSMEMVTSVAGRGAVNPLTSLHRETMLIQSDRHGFKNGILYHALLSVL